MTAFACLVLGHSPERVNVLGVNRCSRCLRVLDDEFLSEAAMRSHEVMDARIHGGEK